MYLIEKRSKIKNYFLQYLTKWVFPLYLQNKNKDFFKNLYENILYKDVIIRYVLKLKNYKNNFSLEVVVISLKKYFTNFTSFLKSYLWKKY